MRKKKWKRTVAKLTEGLLSTVTNATLFQIYLFSASFGKPRTSYGQDLIYREARKNLREVNFSTIKSSLYYLKRKGLIRSLKEPFITKAGKERLENILPVYQKKRPWDGSIYLVTYDISENQRWSRDKLREKLKALGAAPLQASVWLAPYNPTQILHEYAREEEIEESIIVSCIGKDGYIGKRSLSHLLERIYHLREINQEYQLFLEKFRKQSLPPWKTAVSFLKILKNDPQLPWELLPEDWLGEEAYQLYRQTITKIKKSQKKK